MQESEGKKKGLAGFVRYITPTLPPGHLLQCAMAPAALILFWLIMGRILGGRLTFDQRHLIRAFFEMSLEVVHGLVAR